MSTALLFFTKSRGSFGVHHAKNVYSKCIQLPDVELQSVKTGDQPFKCNLSLCSSSEATGRPGDGSIEEGQHLPPCMQLLFPEESIP